MRTAALILASVAAFQAHAQNDCKTSPAETFTLQLNQLGRSSIIHKNGKTLKNCYVTEIRPLFIIYLKNKVLHDLMIEKIRHILSEENNLMLCFDEEKRPILKKQPYSP
jgi:hypothetical protein